MSIEHPVDRGGEGRGAFERIAERASNVASSPVFFVGCAGLVLAWLLSYLLGWSVDLRTFLGDMLTAVTLALVALVKNTERRAEHAVQAKLDAIARALLELRGQTDAGAAAELEDAIGLHEEV